MEKALVIEMKSDFAHWRNPFSLSVLETFLMPQKTAILGIFGGMCGLSESELEKIQEKIKVSVKLEKLRGIVLDLRTLINLKEGGVKTPTSMQLLFKPSYTFVVIGPVNLINELLPKAKNNVFPIYAGISEMIAEIEIKNEIEDVEIQEGEEEFFNVSIPYYGEKYEWKIINSKELIIPPRILKKILLFNKKREERKFIDILEGYNVKIKPLWKVKYITINNEHFPIF